MIQVLQLAILQKWCGAICCLCKLSEEKDGPGNTWHLIKILSFLESNNQIESEK